MGMAPRHGLLENRLFTVGTLLFCSYESVSSWLTITKYGRFPHDPVTVFGLAFVVFCSTSITFRSPFFADRVAFGAITVTFLVMAMRMAPLTSVAMLAAKAIEALMWTIAATVSLVVLLRGLKTLHRNS